MAFDPFPFMRSLKVADRDTNQLVLLDKHMTWPQKVLLQSVADDINSDKPVRYIILKARQIGMSTMIEGLMFMFSVLIPRMNGKVVSHESDSNEHLLRITKTYFENFWGANWILTPDSYAANKLGWKENGSRVSVATAKNKEAARSQTVRFIHGSEVAFWPDPGSLTMSLFNTLPRQPLTFFFLESTANGVGDYFHTTWKAAKEGEVEYKPLFFAWWQHPNYRASRIGQSHLLSSPFIPRGDEEKFVTKYLKTRGLDDYQVHDRMLWRRSILATECAGDVEKLHQEYPLTDDEAFVSTGRNVFKIDMLRAVYAPMVPEVGKLITRPNGRIEFLPDPDGPLKVYRRPAQDRRWGQYLIGGDPAFGGVAGDYSCAQIFNRQSWEQCAVFRARLDAASLGEEMVKLGKWYNDAMLAPEANKGGGAAVAVLKTRGYPNIYIHQSPGNIKGMLATNYGWVTNPQTKSEAIGNLQKALYDAAQPAALQRGLGIRIHDKATFTELKGYVILDGNKYGNSAGEVDHDDLVMATAICLTCIMYENMNLMHTGDAYAEPQYEMLDIHSSGGGPQAAGARSGFEEQLGQLGVDSAPVMHDTGDGVAMERSIVNTWATEDTEGDYGFD